MQHQPAFHRPPVVSAPAAPVMRPVQPSRHAAPDYNRPAVVMHRDQRGRWQRHHVARPDGMRPHERHVRRLGLHYPRGGYGVPFVAYGDGAPTAAYAQAYEAPLVDTHGEPPVIPAYAGVYENCAQPLVIHIGEGTGAQRAHVIHGQSSECGRPQIIRYNRPRVAQADHAPRVIHHRGKKAGKKSAKRADKHARKKVGFSVVRARY